MSLLETLHEKGDDIIDERGEEWLGKLIKEGRKQAEEATAPKEGEKEDPLKGAAGKAAAADTFDVLEANKRPFVRLGKVGFAWVLGHWEDGDEAAAKRRYIATQATFAERRRFMHEAGDRVQALAKEREESWSDVVDVLEQIGSIGVKALVKVALPLLIA